MHFHSMTFMAMPLRKNPCPGGLESYNFGRLVLGHHYYILILYKNHKSHLKKIENEFVRLAKDDSKCKHEILCGAYLITHKIIVPAHNCCDVQEKSSCGNVHDALTTYTDKTDSVDEEVERYVSDEEKKPNK